MDQKQTSAITSFGTEIFKNCFDKTENVLISPLSLTLALGMVMAGTDDETKEEMLNILSPGLSEKAFHEGLSDFVKNLPSSEDTNFTFADSLFVKEGVRIKKRFERKVEKRYNAEIRSLVFDENAVKEINSWVEEHTKGMIDRIMDDISPEAVLYLINALAFEGEWDKVYTTDNVIKGTFKDIDGNEKEADFMWSDENIYIENESCTGFVKPYKGQEYLFAAFLPREGKSVEELIKGLKSDDLTKMLKSARAERCKTALPKFKADYSNLMNEVLYGCGLKRTLSPEADFSGITRGYHGLGDILHKTHIEVDEKGTRAGAVTSVMLKAMGMPVPMPEVILDRPFIYTIVDTRQAVPLFIGQVVTL